jgi:hypothetical protein
MQKACQELGKSHAQGVRLPARGIHQRMKAMQSSAMCQGKVDKRCEVTVRAIPIKKLCGARTVH